MSDRKEPLQVITFVDPVTRGNIALTLLQDICERMGLQIIVRGRIEVAALTPESQSVLIVTGEDVVQVPKALETNMGDTIPGGSGLN
jgi:hypothetical protein